MNFRVELIAIIFSAFYLTAVVTSHSLLNEASQHRSQNCGPFFCMHFSEKQFMNAIKYLSKQTTVLVGETDDMMTVRNWYNQNSPPFSCLSITSAQVDSDFAKNLEILFQTQTISTLSYKKCSFWSIPDIFFLPSLRSMTVDSCIFHHISSKVLFKNLPVSLVELDVALVKSDAFASAYFENLENLQQISLRNIDLTEVDAAFLKILSALPKLSTVAFIDCSIETLANQINGLTLEWTTVEIHNEKMYNFSCDFLCNFSKVKSLKLAGIALEGKEMQLIQIIKGHLLDLENLTLSYLCLDVDSFITLIEENISDRKIEISCYDEIANEFVIDSSKIYSVALNSEFSITDGAEEESALKLLKKEIKIAKFPSVQIQITADAMMILKQFLVLFSNIESLLLSFVYPNVEDGCYHVGDIDFKQLQSIPIKKLNIESDFFWYASASNVLFDFLRNISSIETLIFSINSRENRLVSSLFSTFKCKNIELSALKSITITASCNLYDFASVISWALHLRTVERFNLNAKLRKSIKFPDDKYHKSALISFQLSLTGNCPLLKTIIANEIDSPCISKHGLMSSDALSCNKIYQAIPNLRNFAYDDAASDGLDIEKLMRYFESVNEIKIVLQ